MALVDNVASAVHVSGLSFAYSETINVLQDVNLEVKTGERVGLIGPNGAGKTTLFLLLCGVLKPSTGEITIFEKSIKNGEFRPDIGMVFQNPDDQLFCPSVIDDVAFGPQSMGLSKSEVDIRVNEALSAVQCLGLIKRPPHHLSGGEKRMISIAGVLAMRPKLMIYDEPSASLDIRSRRRVIDLLQESTQTVLISSHDLELISEVCNRVLLIDKGCVIADGKPREIMSDEHLMEAHGQEKPHSLIPHHIHDGLNLEFRSETHHLHLHEE